MPGFPKAAIKNNGAAAEKKNRKICLIASKGSLDMAYPPLILANSARMQGVDCDIFFTFWGMDIITKKKMDKLQVATVGNPNMHPMFHIPTMIGGLPGMSSMASVMMRQEIDKLGFPPVGEFIQLLIDSGVNLYACQMSCDMMGLEQDDFLDGVKIVGAMEFIEFSEDAQVIFV
jgi:peroxiredoxin family protein